jgi:hypothetical protein
MNAGCRHANDNIIASAEPRPELQHASHHACCAALQCTCTAVSACSSSMHCSLLDHMPPQQQLAPAMSDAELHVLSKASSCATALHPTRKNRQQQDTAGYKGRLPASARYSSCTVPAGTLAVGFMLCTQTSELSITTHSQCRTATASHHLSLCALCSTHFCIFCTFRQPPATAQLSAASPTVSTLRSEPHQPFTGRT